MEVCQLEVLRIVGGKRLSGIARPRAAKNAVLPILAAAVMVDGQVVLEGCPRLLDTQNMLEILRTLGVSCAWSGPNIELDATQAFNHEMPGELSRQLRSSIFMMGPLLGRFRKAACTYPGGCEIGLRPIDLHLKSLRALGVVIREAHGMIYCDGRDMRGGEITLDFPSVGATENAMMAAALIRGTTVIHNPAREPEIWDLQQFLNAAGGDVRGAGTGMIEIHGVRQLTGQRYRPIPDRIEAGTILAAVAMTGGEVELLGVSPAHMASTLDKLREADCEIEATEGRIRLRAPEKLFPIALTTLPFPGFPTDMQAQMMALACVANGTSVIVENLFESRFAHAGQMRLMGADITVHDRVAVVRGGRLSGAHVVARDLRGGAALVLAALAAEGTTEVEGVSLIDRGYESIERTLNELGAGIVRLR